MRRLVAIAIALLALSAGAATAWAAFSSITTNTGNTMTAAASSGTCGYRAAVIADGPIAYHRLGEAPGTTTSTDLGSAAANGTYLNGVTQGVTGSPWDTTSDPDLAASFDGVDDYVSVPGFTWSTPGPISISFWTLVSDYTHKGSAFSIGNLDPLRIQAHVPNWDGSIAEVIWEYGGGKVRTRFEADQGKWVHVVLTADGVANGQMHVYLDGRDMPVTYSTQETAPSQSYSGMTIGAFTGRSTGALYDQGRLDEFAVFNKVLTATDVKTLFNANCAA